MSLLISRLDGHPGPSTAASSDPAKQLEALERENAVLRSTVQCLAAYLPDDVAPEVVGVSLNGPLPFRLTPDKQATSYCFALAKMECKAESHGKARYVDNLLRLCRAFLVRLYSIHSTIPAVCVRPSMAFSDVCIRNLG